MPGFSEWMVLKRENTVADMHVRFLAPACRFVFQMDLRMMECLSNDYQVREAVYVRLVSGIDPWTKKGFIKSFNSPRV